MISTAISPFANPSSEFSQVLLDTSSPKSPAPFRAIARNFLCEHRISPERAAEFYKFAGPTPTFAEFEQALSDYQKHKVRPLRDGGGAPAYTEAVNANNSVQLPEGSSLCTVVNLSRWGRFYVEANKTFRLREFRSFDFDSYTDYTQVNARLTERLGDLESIEQFLRAIFTARDLYLKTIEKQRHPIWAAEWSSIEPFLVSSQPERWLQAVGVPCDTPSWLAVLKYPLQSEDKKIDLFRPTQLDAGWYAHHFPSPPQAAPVAGGHTMSLSSSSGKIGRLVSEYIHQEPDFTVTDWIAGGRLIGNTGTPVYGDLLEHRRLHWLLLQAKYEANGVRAWMSEF